jgi:hypothetical protein
MSSDPSHSRARAEAPAPTSTPASTVTRETLHTRHIDLQGFRRSDGLFEVEARLVDRKPHDHVPIRGDRPVVKGQPIHDMGVRLVFNEEMVVHDVHTFTDSSPYADCPGGGLPLQSLKGLKMSKGWSAEVRARLGGPRSCAHLRELLLPLATVAFQSLSALRAGQPERRDAQGRPLKIDSCYAYAAERELVLKFWPDFHKSAQPAQATREPFAG